MKKVILFIAISIFYSLLYTTYWVTHENCNSWIYSSYYNSNADICWYYDIRLYPWKSYDLVDYWKWTDWKERILKASESSINLLNLDNSNYNLRYNFAQFSSNWISSEADRAWYSWKKPVIWWIYDVLLDSGQDTSKLNLNIPVARADWNITTYEVNNNWSIQPPITDWKYCTTSITIVSGERLFSSCNYIQDTWVKKTSTNLKWEHLQSYVILPSWCWDQVVSHNEQCDNWSDNFDGSWTPNIRNWVACSDSCQIIDPICWDAAKEYSNSDSSFDGSFCWQYSLLGWSTPSFPSENSSVNWTCSLWNQTVSCNASRWDDDWWDDDWWGWWDDDWWDDDWWDDDWWGWWDDDWWGWWGWWGNPTSCVSPPCSTWSCWPLDWQTISSTDTTKINYLQDPSTYYNQFCSNWSILSYSYNPTINQKKFNWKCWLQNCSADIKFNSWVIKVYGSYSWAVFACSECDGFDYEWPIRFNSDYDTTYTKSIMSWDYLPFGWILPKYNEIYNTSCNSWSIWEYNKNNVKVQFKVNSIYSSEYSWFAWSSLYAFPDTSVLWQGYIDSQNTPSFNYGENTINWYINYRQKCTSYNVTVPKWTNSSWNTIYWIETRYKWEDDITSPSLFATEKFTMTDHYMIQRWTPLTNVSNVDLNFDWKSLSYYNVSTPNSLPNYNTGDLSKILDSFIWKYKQYAKMPASLLWVDSMLWLKKVLTQDVFYIEWEHINISGDIPVSKPTTLIVENWNVTIDWEITWPFMLVVRNGNIKIQNSKMNIKSTLEWYYITDKSFEVTWPASTTWNILNDNPSSSRWYADGRLLLNWVLIWDDADQIYKKRRSVLKNWFRNWKEYAIKNGWSLTITTNTNIWTNPPIGSKNLFEMLKVSKWE